MNPTTAAAATAIVRHLLTIAGGALAARGVAVDDGTIELVSGSLVALAGVAWSLVEKKRRAAPPAAPQVVPSPYTGQPVPRQ